MQKGEERWLPEERKKRGPIGIQMAGEETGQNRKGRQMRKGQLVAMDMEGLEGLEHMELAMDGVSNGTF